MRTTSSAAIGLLLGAIAGFGCSEGTQGLGKDQVPGISGSGGSNPNRTGSSGGTSSETGGSTDSAIDAAMDEPTGQTAGAANDDASPESSAGETEASTGATSDDGATGTPDATAIEGGPAPAGWYEAEAIPPNEKAE